MRKPLQVPPTAAQLARYRDPAKVQIFYETMMQMGVRFEVDQAGRVMATGRAVSPLIQSETDHRADLLRPLIEAQKQPGTDHESASNRRQTGGDTTAKMRQKARE